MRKSKLAVVIAIIACGCVMGCNKSKVAVSGGNELELLKDYIGYEPPVSNNGVIEIKEKMFMSQVNDVYLNASDYLGKPIKLEGIFMVEQYEKFGPYCYVVRYGPGCCGNDGNVGFEVKWDKDPAKSYPDNNAWVEATGVLQYYNEDFVQYLYLDLSSLNVLDKRGVEYVRQ